MLTRMEKIFGTQILKYSAGQHIFCPKCNKVADYRKWVIWESPSGQHGAHCTDCHRDILSKVHDDKPHAYLQSIGWQFTTLVDFDKPVRKQASFPQKSGKTLNAYLRKDIAKHMRTNGWCAKTDRIFPAPQRIGANIGVNDDGEWSSFESTRAYVEAYCGVNHLCMP